MKKLCMWAVLRLCECNNKPPSDFRYINLLYFMMQRVIYIVLLDKSVFYLLFRWINEGDYSMGTDYFHVRPVYRCSAFPWSPPEEKDELGALLPSRWGVPRGFAPHPSRAFPRSTWGLQSPVGTAAPSCPGCEPNQALQQNQTFNDYFKKLG